MRVSKDTPESVGASLSDQKVSEVWTPKDRLNMLVQVWLSAVVEAAGITIKLVESFDGRRFHAVGNQSEVALTSDSIDAAQVANATNTFTETSHGLVTGDALIVQEDNTLPAGLTDLQLYYVIWASANTFKLALTYEDAVKGVPVAISSDGTAGNTYWKANYQIRLVESDATDAAQLPTAPYVAVAVDTGAGDSITISDVYV